MGVEPTSEAWEASILPMNYSRIFNCVNISLTQTTLKIKRKIANIPKNFATGFGSCKFSVRKAVFGIVKCRNLC